MKNLISNLNKINNLNQVNQVNKINKLNKLNNINNINNNKKSIKKYKNKIKPKIILAFSGGLDTSAIVPWLKENYDAEVIAYCSDLGNLPSAKYLSNWAKKIGVSKFIFEDLKSDLVKKFVFPVIKAGATYQDDYLLGTALARPLIAERMAFYAKKEKAYALSHGATGKGNDHLRFEKSWAYLVPDKKIIAPWKIWPFKGRKDLIKYLEEKNLKINSEEKKYSVDINLFHRSCEGGILENISKDYNTSEILNWIQDPKKIKNQSINIIIEFSKGIPIKLNNKLLSPNNLLHKLNVLAGRAGVGINDVLEERANGIKSRGVYETPGGSILHVAIKNLKHLCWSRNLLNTARILGIQYGELIYDGLWHSDQRKAIDAFFEEACKNISGIISLEIVNGHIKIKQRNSRYSLYNEKMVSFEGDIYDLYKYSEGYSKTVCFPQWQAGKRDNY